MDLLIVLGILAVAAALGTIVARGLDPRRWPRLAVLVVIVGVYGHLAVDAWALGAATLLTLVGIILPAMVASAARRRAMRGDFAGAARIAARLGRFRPVWAAWSAVWSAADAWSRGDGAPAATLIAHLAADPSPAAQVRRETLLGLTRDWASARHALSVDLQARALCELAEVEAGVETAARAWAPRMRWSHIRRARTAALAPLAFAGRVESTDLLTGLMRLPRAARRIWHATAVAAAGHPADARTQLEAVAAERQPAPIRTAIDARLDTLPHPAALSSTARAVLDDLGREVAAGDLLRSRGLRTSPVTLGILGLMAVGYVLQLVSAGGTEARVAYDLGALYAEGRLPDELWRLLAYGFLHSGMAHLGANALAIGILGPIVDRAMGAGRAFVVFFGGVVLGGVGISLLGAEGITVGASAGAMALLGALLVNTRLHHVLAETRTGRAAWRLGLLLVVFQTALDAVTPMISSAGHLTGGLTGLALGALMARRR